MLKVVGIDPGESVGIALWEGDGMDGGGVSVWECLSSGRMQSWTFTSEWAKKDRLEHCAAVQYYLWELGLTDADCWAIERWQPGAGPGSSNTSADQVGWYLAGWLGGYTMGIEFQGPSEAMTFATDKRLKDAGLWVPGRPHENDARRHVCVRLAKGV